MSRGSPVPHEKSATMAARRAPGDVGTLWYRESAINQTRELPAPCIVALEHAEQRRDEVAPPGTGDTSPGGSTMERVIERGCGLDVHKKTVAACVRVPGATNERVQHVRTFGTTAADL